MARKLFSLIEGATSAEESNISAEQDLSTEQSASPMLATSRLSAGLMNLHSNTIRDLDPDAISEGGLRDRLAMDSAGIEELANSIRENGQHVPIMVRPLPDEMDRFQIVYGRRRLAAIRLIGNLPVRAIVRSLKDKEALIAQGQENNQRLDPSHIERALFALEMREAGYQTDVIMQALGIDHYSVSRFVNLAKAIPGPIIEAIGPAHETGRRYWHDFRTLIEALGPIGIEAASARLAQQDARAATSDERFHLALERLKEVAGPVAPAENSQTKEVDEREREPNRGATAPEAAATTGLNRGATRARFGRKGHARVEMKADDRAVSLTVKVKDSPEFSEWLRKHAEEVVAEMAQRWIEAEKGA